jgi:hypothetical protein
MTTMLTGTLSSSTYAMVKEERIYREGDGEG